MLDASFSYLRQFVPAVLAALSFDGPAPMNDLLAAVSVLADLYATGTRKVPAGAATSFVPARWQGYLDTATKSGDITAYRHYWELTVLMALRDGLRCGDVYVPGSRRYADPAAFLISAERWETQRTEYCHLVGKSPDAAHALAVAGDELHTALSDLEPLLASGTGAVRLSSTGELIVPHLTAEVLPAEVDSVRGDLSAMMPRVPFASLLVEVDARTGMLDYLIHAGGKQTRPPQLKRNLLYVIIAEATNLGLGRVLRGVLRRFSVDSGVVPPGGDAV